MALYRNNEYRKAFVDINLPTDMQNYIISFLEKNKEIYKWKSIFTNNVIPLINKGFILTAYLGTVESLNIQIGCPNCYINAVTANTCFYRCFKHHKVQNYKWIWTSLEEFYFAQWRISIISIIGKKSILNICGHQDYIYLQKFMQNVVLKKYINKKIVE